MSRLRLTPVLDWLTLAGLLVALAIYVSGGFSFRIDGVRFTARSAARASITSLALIAIRFAADRRTRPFAAPAAFLRRRVYRPDADTVPVLTPRSARRARGAAVLGIAAFATYALYPQLTHMDSVADLGDPLFSIWRLGWVHHYLADARGTLFDANIFYPAPLTFTYSDSMLLPALIASPLLAAGVHPVTVYNLLLVGSFLASSFAVYLLVEHLTAYPGAAFVSALLFGFYPFRFEHYSHLELLATYCMPLSLLALHRFLTTGSARAAIGAAVSTAAQLYCSMYYAVLFLWYGGAVALMVCLVVRPPLRRLLVPGALAGVLLVVLAFPLYRTYRSAHLGDREVHEVTPYSATATDYLRPHARSATWGQTRWAREGPQPPERALFPGIVALALAAIALIPPLGAMRLVYGTALVAAFELSRGMNGLVYPFLYEWLPFMRGLRSPARASVLVGLSLGVLAGFAVSRLLSGASPLRRRFGVALAIVAAAIDLRPSLQLEPVWREPPPIYRSISGVRGVVLAEFPFTGDPAAWITDTPYMYFSLWHWAKLINGYSGHAPATYGAFQAALRSFPDADTIRLLRARGTTHITVNCALYRDGCEALLDRIDQFPQFRLLTSARWQGRPVRLYMLNPEADGVRSHEVACRAVSADILHVPPEFSPSRNRGC
jgi:hypothetical protein